MRKRLLGIAAAALVAAVPAAAPAVAPAKAPLTAVASKSCSSGYTHAVIRGAHKCLRRGQYCARSADRQYHKYGYHCHKRDAYGSYHLT
jgi:hypothetical protein